MTFLPPELYDPLGLFSNVFHRLAICPHCGYEGGSSIIAYDHTGDTTSQCSACGQSFQSTKGAWETTPSVMLIS